jgi:6-phosphogluconolactonase
MPGDIHFDADGSVLFVSEEGTQLIDTYRVDFLGYASGPISHHSSGVTPFGFSVTNRGYAIVSEAGSNAASSYETDENGDLKSRFFHGGGESWRRFMTRSRRRGV